MTSVINYEAMEQPIKDIETILSVYDRQEKKMILEQVFTRIEKQEQKERIKDNFNDTLPSWVTKLLNKKSQEEGED